MTKGFSTFLDSRLPWDKVTWRRVEASVRRGPSKPPRHQSPRPFSAGTSPSSFIFANLPPSSRERLPPDKIFTSRKSYTANKPPFPCLTYPLRAEIPALAQRPGKFKNSAVPLRRVAFRPQSPSAVVNVHALAVQSRSHREVGPFERPQLTNLYFAIKTRASIWQRERLH